MFDGAEPGGPLAPELRGTPRRALIMAGGGLKVAFQAGVLQVWLDEARDGAGRPLEFLHADGASGGVFNLAMWCQGMSGRRIAENWRRFSPVFKGAALNWRGLPRLESIFSMDRFRTNVLRGTWGLDWSRIAATKRSASFNVFDVDAQRLVTLPPSGMSEDLMIAATSLPFWYPPQEVNGTTYIDGVFATDANLDAAIDAGCDELWIAWTVSTAGRWRDGPVAHYFQVIEACANGALHRDLDRIARSNRDWAAGHPGEFPHPVRVVPLQAEVPLHYLFVFSRRRFVRAVDLGVQQAREWCRSRGIDVRPGIAPEREPVGIRFRERMSGPVAFGARESDLGAQLGDARGDLMTLDLEAEIADLEAFRLDGHRVALTGSVECAALGGRLPVENGTLSLLPGAGAGRPSTMEYRLDLADGTGRPLTLLGTKTVRDDPGPDLWSDTTTLDVGLFPRSTGNGSRPDPVLSGRLRLTPGSFLRMLPTIKGTGAESRGRRLALVTFAAFFLHRLADIYRHDAPPAAVVPSAFDGWPAGEEPAGARVFAHNERVVPAPPERVWELLVDAHGWSDYYPNAQFVDIDGPARKLRRGSVFRWVTFGLPISSQVDLHEPHCRLGWRWRGLGAHGYHVWLLEPDEHGTRIVTEETQRGLLPWLLRPVLRRVLPAGHELWLRRLGRASRR